MRYAPLTVTVLTLGLALLSSPALAKKPEHAGKHEIDKIEYKGNDKGHYDDGGLHVTLRFDNDSRMRAQSYMRDHYRPHCPPGLAKKHNGCLPPGQAKKYRVGGALPPTFEPLPHDLLSLIGPPPPGAFYAMVDKDVLLVSEATKKILDAVTLLSAMD